MDRNCGSCGYYAMTSLHGPLCSKHRREVSALKEHNDCWTDPSVVAEEKEVATKVCSECGRELPVENFGRHFKTKDGYQPCCRECQSKKAKNRQPRQRKEKPEKEKKVRGPKSKHPDYINPEGVTMHWCGHCDTYKPTSEFSRDHSNKSGLATACKACRVAMENERRKRIRREKKAEKQLRDSAENCENTAEDLRDSAENCENTAEDLRDSAEKDVIQDPDGWSETEKSYLEQAIETLEHEDYLILAQALKSLRPQSEVLPPGFYLIMPDGRKYYTKEFRYKDMVMKIKDNTEDVEIVNESTDPIPPIPTLYSATDDQLVQELRSRGYSGNIIKKTSFIL